MRSLTLASIFSLLALCCIAADALVLNRFLDVFKPKSSRHEIIDSTGDDKPIEDIGLVADVLCQWSSAEATQNINNNPNEKKQISRLSTVSRLVDFFDTLESQGPARNNYVFRKCAERYKQILADLNEVVSRRSDNVCSDEKLSAIEQFHNRHLSTSAKGAQVANSDKLNARAELHPMLGLFFMYYAMEVSSICRRSVVHSLEWDMDQFKFTREEYELGEDNNLALLLSGISDYFGPLDRVQDLDDVIYLWDLLDNEFVGKIIGSTLLIDESKEEQSADREKTTVSVDPETGSPIRLLIKVQQGHQAKFIQNKCLNRFRPIYSKVIMPVTRLSNLGYSSADNGKFSSSDKSELAQNKHLKRWYSLVQICEAIRPIKFYEDPTLGPEDAVIMTKGEADKLVSTFDGLPKEEMIEYEPKTNSMLGRDRLLSVERIESQALVKKIKLNVSAHDRSMGRIFSRLVWNSFDVFKSKIFGGGGGKIVLHKPAAGDNNGDSPAVEFDLRKELRKSIDMISDKELLERVEMSRSSQTETAPGVVRMSELELEPTRRGEDVGEKEAAKEEPKSPWSPVVNGIVLNIVQACANLGGRLHSIISSRPTVDATE